MGYRSRTGVTTLKLLTKKFCALIVKFQVTLDTWIDTIPDAPNRALVRAAFVAMQSACLIIQSTPDD